MNEDSKLGVLNGSLASSPNFYNKIKSPRSVIHNDQFVNEIKYNFPMDRRKTHELKSPIKSIKSKRCSEERAKIFFDKQMSFVGNKFGKIIKELNQREEGIQQMMK